MDTTRRQRQAPELIQDFERGQVGIIEIEAVVGGNGPDPHFPGYSDDSLISLPGARLYVLANFEEEVQFRVGAMKAGNINGLESRERLAGNIIKG